MGKDADFETKSKRRGDRVREGGRDGAGSATLYGMGVLTSGTSLEATRKFMGTPDGRHEVARRMIVYRGMIDRLGHIEYAMAAAWQPQPTQGEIEAELVALGEVRKGARPAKAKECAA